MKLLCIALGVLPFISLVRAEPLDLRLSPENNGLVLKWPASARPRVAGVTLNNFKLQSSSDFKTWQTLPKGTLLAPDPAGLYSVPIDSQNEHLFYRVQSEINLESSQPSGAAVFGYTDAIQTELQKLGALQPATFQTQFSLTNQYLDHISFDPLQLKGWTNFFREPVTIRSWDLLRGFTIDYRLIERDRNLAHKRSNGE